MLYVIFVSVQCYKLVYSNLFVFSKRIKSHSLNESHASARKRNKKRENPKLNWVKCATNLATYVCMYFDSIFAITVVYQVP